MEAESMIFHCSGRVARQSDRYNMYHINSEVYTVIIDESDDKPVAHLKAIASSDANL